MKRLSFLLFLTLVLVSCGTDGHRFKFEGRLLNLNQGELYLYSPDGVIDGIDTIGIKNGRFSYERKCEGEGTVVIVFPNFSEQPVFVKPGADLTVKGDATHLKKLKVTGSKQNKLMNAFREQVAIASPPETQQFAETFIKDHPESIVATYILSRYFLRSPQPDYAKANALLKKLIAAQPDNEELKSLRKKIAGADALAEGRRLPVFSAVDIYGNAVSSDELMEGMAVIYLWASWDYESCTFQRTVREIMEREGSTVKGLGISLDASDVDCFRLVDREQITARIVRENGMFEAPLPVKLGLNAFPDNAIVKDGVVIARGVNVEELRETFKPSQSSDRTN